MNEETLFNLALEKPSHERSAFLDATCAEDAELRRRVERLLKAHDNPGSFMQEPVLQSTGGSQSELTQALEPGAAVPMDASKTQSDLSQSVHEDLAFLAPSTRPGSLGRLEHYHVLQVIGKGGFGTVLKAFDERLHRVVAIKVLSMELSASGTARQRFIREARTAAAVTHEHVVTIHAVVEEHRPPYLVMQLIDGVTLQDKLDKVGMLTLREILRIGMQMAEGLAAAHKQGLVHRDIKPANILLENGVERVKITDFGLAKIADDASVTQSGVVAGTPMYMSPEQANGETLDHRSDLFSLGTVLYVMCTGRPPFRASGTMGVLKRVIDDTPRPVREINPEIPDWLEAIIDKLHAKKAEDRFQTAKDVAEVLSQRLADVQAGREIGRASGVSRASEAPANIAPPPTANPEGSPAPRRSWLAWIGLILLALVGIWFTFAGAVSVIGGHLTDQGRALAPFILVAGPSILAWTIFLASRQSWLRWLTGTAGTLLAVASLAAPFVYLRLAPLPPPMGWLDVSTHAKNVRVEVIALDDADGKHVFPPQEIIGQLLDKRVSVGNWKVIAYRGDRVHYQIEFALLPGQTKRVIIPETPTLEPGWVQLFNGKDLTGWKTHPTQPGNWRVDANDLASSAAAGYLFSEKGDWQDFHLRAEVHIVEGGNSGIFFRTPFELEPTGKPGDKRYAPKGWYEAEIFWAALAKPGRIQNLAETTETLAQPNQWMTVEIIAQGNRLITRINGKTAVDVVDSKSSFKSGHIALQAFTPTTSVRFKKIEIKELPPEELGWVQLFNGKDLTGWQEKKFQKNVWKVVDGILKGQGTDRNLLWSDRDNYRDFHLKVETRVQATGDGSISFRRSNKKFYEAKIRPGSQAPTGILFRSPDATPLSTTMFPPPDEWFTLEVIARGSRLQVLVNGKTAADVLDTTSMEGQLTIQAHGTGGSVEYRKIAIKELPPEEPGWVSLFNGKDLSGWIDYIPKSKAWKVEEGILHARGSSSTLTNTRKDLTDFHLRLEMKTDSLTRAMLFPRSDFPKDLGHGIWLMGVKDRFTPFSLALGLPPKTVQQAKSFSANPDDWLLVEIVARGKQLLIKVNGEQVLDWIDPAPVTAKGQIALMQLPNCGPMQIRKIEFKELAPMPAIGEWASYFNGKDLTGWRVRASAGKGDWKVQEGLLIGNGGRYIDSDRLDWKNFHLRLEAKLKGSGHVWYHVHHNDLKGGLNVIHYGKADSLRGAIRTPIDPNLHPETKKVDFPADSWVTLEIISDGPRLVTKTNGVVTEDITLTSKQQKKWYKQGIISLGAGSLDGGTAEWTIRKIEIKELLPPFAVAPFDAAKAKEHQDAWAKHLGVDVEMTNSIGMKLRLIPPGEFLMGSTDEQMKAIQENSPEWSKKYFNTENPARRQPIADAFYLAAKEVTVGQFRQFVKEKGYKTDVEKSGKGGLMFDESVKVGPSKMIQNPEYIWHNPLFAAVDDHPVVLISTADAEAFCRWLSDKTGRTYRLPTEIEWEYACRAGTTTLWYTGDDPEQLRDAEWTSKNSNRKVRPGGGKPPNPFGLFDMLGNVEELCQRLPSGKVILRGGHVRESYWRSRSACRIEGVDETPFFLRGFRVALVGDLTAKSALEEGWVQLFNGKNFDQWHQKLAKQNSFTIVDDVLTCNLTGSTLLSKKDNFRDLHLKMEVRSTETTNASVNVRSQAARRSGHCIELGWVEIGGKYAPGSIIYRAGGQQLAQATLNLPKPGEWFTLEVIAKGKRLETKVNGKTTQLVNGVDDPKTGGGIAIDLYNHNKTVQVRKIEIKELPPEEPGWVQLFNGKDVTGWKPFPLGAWTVKEGNLVGTAKGACRLTAERTDYQDFHLRFKAKTIYGMGIACRVTDQGFLGIDYSRSNNDCNFSHGDKDPKVQGAAWKVPAIAADEWFDGEMIVQGPRMTFYLNGFKVAELTGVPIRKGRLNLIVPPGLANVVQFQKIEIKELPPAPNFDARKTNHKDVVLALASPPAADWIKKVPKDGNLVVSLEGI